MAKTRLIRESQRTKNKTTPKKKKSPESCEVERNRNQYN